MSKAFLLLTMLIAVLIVSFIIYRVSFFDADDTVTNENATNVTLDSNVNSETTSKNTNQTGVSPILDKAAQARDLKRINDMNVVRAALNSYFGDKNEYPKTLDDLVSGGYIQYIPVNPSPRGRPYVYTPIGAAPYQYYDMIYSLEIGTQDIEAGDHVATPSGIATP